MVTEVHDLLRRREKTICELSVELKGKDRVNYLLRNVCEWVEYRKGDLIKWNMKIIFRSEIWKN